VSELPRPRYPVFVPSKGRHATAGDRMTVGRLLSDGVPFRLVVEPAEEHAYRERYPSADVLVTPRDEMRLLGVRNWIREVSIDEGHERHWQLDDNIKDFRRLYRGHRIPVDAGVALRVCEDFTDRYTNIGVSGLNYQTFVRGSTPTPFWHNVYVYSTSLIWNRMPYRWRALYNDDTDLCLQVLAGGLCTVALNLFMANKAPTMVVKGGNTDDLYQGDGRLRMARSLQRQWPYVVETKRRFGRPQHVIKGAWRGFDTPLIRRDDLDWEHLPRLDEYGLRLDQVADEIESPTMRRLVERYDADMSS
jgi:hypothetical protein